jgi:hypothetical protein
MILASHIIVSGLIGAETHSYFLAAIFGFLSHYVLDGIPHWDKYISEEFKSKAKTEKNFLTTKFFWKQLLKIAFDAIIGFTLLFLFLKFLGQNNTSFSLIGAFFGVLPDPLMLLYMVKKWRILKWNYDINEFVHYSIHSKIKQAFWPGIIIQATTIGLVFVSLVVF